MVALHIRPARREDVDALVDLNRELLQFYGVQPPFPRVDMIRRLKAELFVEAPTVEVMLAFAGDEAVGMLAFAEIYAVAVCRRSLFIQDIFVSKTTRGLGVGQALMLELAHIAEQRNAFQIDWTADLWNEEARRFYETLAPVLKAEKMFYRLAGANLRQFLDGAKPPRRATVR
ncbi:GNAT family N-acetyltransferase [Oceanibaculum pacificum]|nr:GNAT family N-acetyltransferase [Oceanibaculum pacificum]